VACGVEDPRDRADLLAAGAVDVLAFEQVVVRVRGRGPHRHRRRHKRHPPYSWGVLSREGSRGRRATGGPYAREGGARPVGHPRRGARSRPQPARPARLARPPRYRPATYDQLTALDGEVTAAAGRLPGLDRLYQALDRAAGALVAVSTWDTEE